mmetsp:Transcript_23078/g.33801  ORF Transcript_23078/g.33801 Transcript_23078/m.33801 type:complete len:347 (+) Transcript_23078:114-1154(+)
MICVLSPAKTMIRASDLPSLCLPDRSVPALLEQAQMVGRVLKAKTKKELKTLCGVSDNLSSHVKSLCDNFVFFSDVKTATTDICERDKEHFNQAALMFNGPAFQGLDAKSLSGNDAFLLQKHLRILTGLYGPVRPADFIQEHRLCMGTKLEVNGEKDLYSFWRDSIANEIVADLMAQQEQINTKRKKSKGNSSMEHVPSPLLLINCASQEYFKSISPHLPSEVGVERTIPLRIVECVFLDGGMIKSAFAKRARGLMARYVCIHGDVISCGSDEAVDKIKEFDYEGYSFSERDSTSDRLVFTRAKPPSSAATKASNYKMEKSTAGEGRGAKRQATKVANEKRKLTKR